MRFGGANLTRARPVISSVFLRSVIVNPWSLTMSRRSRRKTPVVGPCVHCGTVAELTDDHIPPKALFANRPSDLITVPSCGGCNGGASKDDEYFRLVVISRYDAGEHPEADRLMPKAWERVYRPEAKGFRRSMEKSMRTVEVFSPGGILLGTAPGYDVDLRRLNRVVKRMVSGLFYHEFGERVPDTHEAIAFAESGYKGSNPATLEWLRAKCEAIQSSAARGRGEGVFTYWVRRTEEDPYTTGWVLVFYGAVGFLGFTTPKGGIRWSGSQPPPPGM
jgi:hypothetical protein